ncbi:prepilin-type N-terminal cleavage/methylation domain-containing protein [Patescibacteria group bacterium]|nr:MAG: prepilin-type N-terminal cleavage/methylation domain-containing protein [Patescibacteria group bacterium]
MKQSKGFSLIELLVVVAIIGLLATLAVVALNGARIKARDGKRLSDLKQIQTALELYQDENNSYPAGASAALGGTNYACLNASGFAAVGCANALMGRVPTDPKNSGVYVYTYNAASSTYSVTANLEGTMEGLSGGITLVPGGIQD